MLHYGSAGLLQNEDSDSLVPNRHPTLINFSKFSELGHSGDFSKSPEYANPPSVRHQGILSFHLLFQHFFVFHHKISVFSIFIPLSNFRNTILINKKNKSLIRNCQWYYLQKIMATAEISQRQIFKVSPFVKVTLWEICQHLHLHNLYQHKFSRTIDLPYSVSSICTAC